MIVLKVGGGSSINWEYVAEDVKNLNQGLIVVHGANAKMNEICDKLGIQERVIISPSGHTSRYTDRAALEALIMVYSGLMNKTIVAAFQRHGINAVGLSGADGKIWQGTRKEAIISKEGDREKIIRDSLTGNVEAVNASLLNMLVGHKYLPVLTIPAITHDGELINVDNDRAVAVMARELGVKKVVILFEAPGLLADEHDEGTRIPFVERSHLGLRLSATKGRMRKKILGIQEAFSAGVECVYLGDGRIPHPVTSALAGKGTVIS